MANGMTPADLARFTAEARRIFRGDWEEEIWHLSLSRIRGLRPSLAMAALHEYGVQHGGQRARFIPGKFLEVVAALTRQDADTRAEAKRQAEGEVRALADRDERRRVAQEWQDLRRDIEQAGEHTRRNAVDALIASGWPRPPADLAAWPRSWVLAVADIVTRRARVETYSRLASIVPAIPA